MNYADWEEAAPETIKQDAVWQLEAYRLGLFAAELAWFDQARLRDNPHTRGVADCLQRAVASISANLAQGYSQGSAANRACYYEFALGAARESRDWYYKCRHRLGETVTRHRLVFLGQLIRLLLALIPQPPRRPIRLGSAAQAADPHTDIPPDLLRQIPFAK